MRHLLRWFASQTLGFYLNLCALLALVGLASAAQTTSWDVHNLPQMYLDASIGASQTANIKISALVRNGSTVTLPTTTGGVLRIRQGSRVEDISFTGATVNSTTKVATLLGVTRDLCWNLANSLTACGNGQAFSKGAIVELNVDARLLNFKADVDRMNTFSGSGGIFCSSASQPCLYTLGVTTAQRNAFSFGTAAGYYPDIFNTTLGVRQYWNGSSWVNYGSGSTVNATTTVKGASELATVADVSGSTILGDSGAPVFLGTNLIIRHSTGNTIAARNKVVATNNFGTISGSLLPNLPLNKFNGGTNASTTTFWRGDGTWAVTTGPQLVYNKLANGTATGASLSKEVAILKPINLTGSLIQTGDIYDFDLNCGYRMPANTIIRMYMSGTLLRSINTDINNGGANTVSCKIKGQVTIFEAGASGTAQSSLEVTIATLSGSTTNNRTILSASGSAVTINTTKDQPFRFTVDPGDANAAYYVLPTKFTITRTR